MSRIKDTDYLSISTRVRVLENRLLTREKLERMIDARDQAEAAKVLSECGYGELSEFSPAALEGLLAAEQRRVFQDVGGAVPNPGLLDVFRIKYDYQNAKALVKAQAADVPAERLLVAGGRYEPAALAEDYRREDLSACTPAFARSVQQARETLAATGDAQLSDFVLDRSCFAELVQAGKDSRSSFVQGYVALLVDAANLRSAVRALRLDRGADFLRQVLLPGGNVPEDKLLAIRGEELERLYRSTPLEGAAALGAALTRRGSGPLTQFEKACDDAVTAYVSTARRIPFGEQPVMGYLYARESELTAIRIVMSGRMAGLDGDTIRARLRRCYC